MRDKGTIRAKAVYLAVDINLAGEKEVLGLWIAHSRLAFFLAHSRAPARVHANPCGLPPPVVSPAPGDISLSPRHSSLVPCRPPRGRSPQSFLSASSRNKQLRADRSSGWKTSLLTQRKYRHSHRAGPTTLNLERVLQRFDQRASDLAPTGRTAVDKPAQGELDSLQVCESAPDIDELVLGDLARLGAVRAVIQLQ